MNNRFTPVIQEIDVLVAERRGLAAAGPHFRVLHKFREFEPYCCAGEEVGGVLLVYRSREYMLPLSLALLLLFDYLARNRRLPQSAAQVVAGLRNHPFYARHGMNAKSGVKLTRRFSHSSIKVYIERTRQALQAAFDEAGANLNPFAVLISEETEGNMVRYRLKATVEWIHLD
jgi:hypothetical protein